MEPGIRWLLLTIFVLLERDDGGHYVAAEDPNGVIEDLRELATQEWHKAVEDK